MNTDPVLTKLESLANHGSDQLKALQKQVGDERCLVFELLLTPEHWYWETDDKSISYSSYRSNFGDIEIDVRRPWYPNSPTNVNEFRPKAATDVLHLVLNLRLDKKPFISNMVIATMDTAGVIDISSSALAEITRKSNEPLNLGIEYLFVLLENQGYNQTRTDNNLMIFEKEAADVKSGGEP